MIALLSLLGIFFYVLLHFFYPSLQYVPLWIVIAAGGIPLFFQILMKLYQREWGADLLAAIALVGAVSLNEYLAATLIILMLATGQTLEFYAMRKASSVLLALSKRMPSIAHRKIADNIEDITLQDIHLDDQIVVYPHELCPVDGEVVEGNGSMDESYLTGEPYEISKAPGSFVLSGSINGESVLLIRVQKLPADSRYATIVAVLTEAEQKRPTLRRLGDEIGALFAPIALLLAFMTWIITGDAIRFLSVIVIATPCPLFIAIPIAIISAISMAARQGIIIKDPTVLERLPTCRTAIFDKTGTLTYGKPALTEIIPADQFNPKEILQYAASLERYSKHPLSSAILNAAKIEQLVLLDASEVSEKPGAGLQGVIQQHTIQITHRKQLSEKHPQFNAQLPPLTAGLECIILLDQQYAGTFRFRDLPRSDSKSFINHLTPSHQFNKVMLVSGDRESEVNYLANLLNITEVRASQTPEQKLAIVRTETKQSPTLFMGDGINDAPALTSATVGVAFGQYTNVTAEAAGAVIMENTLQKVDTLMHLCINTRNIALQSAIGGMILSLIGMGFAAAGMIPPALGAILQEVIDVLAIVNALRLTWQRKIETDFNGSLN